MSPYFATHAGMLSYVAREFNELARADAAEGEKLAIYASILERMVHELNTRAEPSTP
jgi:hypothetical protein